MKLKIKRRKRKRSRNGGGSPCCGCSRESKSKNFGKCNGCGEPYIYAMAVEGMPIYGKALDYTDPIVISHGIVKRANISVEDIGL